MPLKHLLHGLLLLKIDGGIAFTGNGALRLRLSPSPSPSPSQHPFQLPTRTRTRLPPKELSLRSSRSDSNTHKNPSNDNSNGSSTTTSTSTTPTTVASQAALIAGTTIGGGFLALPTATAPCGAVPAALGLIGVWLFLLGSAFSLTSAIFMMKQLQLRNEEEEEGEENVMIIPEAEAGDVTVFSLIRECFGSMAGMLGGLLFLLLIKVTLVAQLSKVGVLLESAFPMMDRRVWTTLFSISITIVCIVGKQRKIERINDALTSVMLISFASLVTLAGGSGWSMHGLMRSDYNSLLPSFFLSSTSSSSYSRVVGGGGGGDPWAIPIFIQLLIYNEVVPLVASRLGDERKVRRAILFGSSVPLIMCLVWSCVALGLVPYEPALSTSSIANGVIYDPLAVLRGTVLAKGGGSIGKLFLASVNVLAGSAICTTVIGSVLASAQYLDGMIKNLIGQGGRRAGGDDGNATKNDRSIIASDDDVVALNENEQTRIPSKYRKLITHALAVAPSTAIAMRGSSNLYYRATSFAGEFPCTLLYGLIPPLCNLRIRWKHHGKKKTTEGTVGRQIPWKVVALQVVLAMISMGILVVSCVSK